ncbi:flagellar hook-associated protein FlgK [Colwelliaceae bacterium 6471]
MGYNMLDIGRSGLNAAQTHLDVTSHNISNVNTEGYSRQTAEQQSVIGNVFGPSLLGNGTEITAVERSFNNLIYKNVIFNKSQYSYYENSYEQHSQLEDLLGNSETGLTPTLEGFFDGINGLTEEPTLYAARSVVLTNANVTAQRFNSINDDFQRQSKAINTSIESTVLSINEIADQIKLFNEQIQIASSQGSATITPNDLMDKRNQAIAELSELVDVQVLQRENGMLDISIGSGITLVTGITTLPLTTVRNEYDSTVTEVSLESAQTGNPTTNITSQLTGGSLSALIDFQKTVLTKASQDLGKIALGYADTYNRQQSQGLDLDGNIGENMFLDINDPSLTQRRALNSSQNPVDSTVAVTIRNTSLLSGEDYLMTYDGVNLTFTDTNGNALPAPAAPFPPPAAGTIVEIPGTGIGIEIVTNNLAAGDSFLIRPTFNAGESIDVVMSDPTKVAAAQHDLNFTDINNPNGVDFELYAIDDAGDANFPAIGAPIRIEIDAGGTNYRVTDDLGAVLVAYAPIPNDMPIEAAGMRFNISGNIAGGEVFEVGANDPSTFGVGDNRNALKMLEFQSNKALDGGTNSMTESFAQLLSYMGNSTSISKVQTSAFETSLSLAEGDMATTSGVNLDEEAANLIRFQQSYSAAARVISVASEIFNTLIQAAR